MTKKKMVDRQLSWFKCLLRPEILVIVLFFTVICILLQESSIRSNIYGPFLAEDKTVNRIRYFSVQSYRIENDNFELYEDNYSVHTGNVLTIKGLSYLLNQAKELMSMDPNFAGLKLANASLFKSDRIVTNVSCRGIFEGNKTEIKRVENISKTFVKHEITPEEYILMTQNCSDFTKRRGYIMHYLTEVERDFPLAYSIMMYKDVEQTERLLRAIYRPQNFYCIHVDSKSTGKVYQAMEYIARCFRNVFMSSKRYKVKWGTMTVLEPDLHCMEELLNKSSSWKYFINLTGQEFPLKTNYELVMILTAYNGSNDISATKKGAFKKRWKTSGPPPHGIVPRVGSVHIVASRGYAEFVLHDQRAKDFLSWTSNTRIPDETFFSTLNHNPVLGVPGSYIGEPERDDFRKPFMARYKNWGTLPCAGKKVRGICILATGDLPVLAQSNKLFANKFHLDFHPFALDCLEEYHYNKTRDLYLGQRTFDPKLYSKLGYVTNKFSSEKMKNEFKGKQLRKYLFCVIRDST